MNDSVKGALEEPQKAVVEDFLRKVQQDDSLPATLSTRLEELWNSSSLSNPEAIMVAIKEVVKEPDETVKSSDQ